MSVSRRDAILGGAVAVGGAVALTAKEAIAAQDAGKPRAWEPTYSGQPLDAKPERPGEPGKDYKPVVTPNGAALPFKVVNGVKVFHLIAEEVDHEFAPGLKAKCWGYNGRVHGPTIEAVEGDRVRIYVTNKLPAARTTIHWHGIFTPSGMDGVGGLNQATIKPKETFRYEFTLRQNGTFMYHSHHDEMTQMALGMMGLFVIHPRKPSADYRVDRDFAMLLSEWSIRAGAARPDPNEMTDFNVLTINAKAFPSTSPLIVKRGERVRFRFGNLSATDHHPMHLHGHHFKVVATDGGQMHIAGQIPEATVLVPVGSTRDVEFIADNPGDWALHCHMTHHIMNQMGHGFPNTTGMDASGVDENVRKLVPGYMTMGQHGMADMADMKMDVPQNSIPMLGAKGPFETITMGGMFTILKVRDKLESYDKDPGWYKNPPGTVASLATAEELKRDGIP
ncbi:MAG: copper oxidase [Polyangiaceae bacterium]|nr:copper oxidase [Polyangiaceae bacterium]